MVALLFYKVKSNVVKNVQMTLAVTINSTIIETVIFLIDEYSQ